MDRTTVADRSSAVTPIAGVALLAGIIVFG
jgi:hypothetical protein